MSSTVERRSCDIAIVGAGPAGLMAAETLATAGHRVTIYERMPSPARKFLLAGRGGLNLTHSEPLEDFLERYGQPSPILRNAIVRFPADKLIDWAQGLGLETFVGSSGRVFPKSMKSSPLLRAWLKRLDVLGVALKRSHTWIGCEPTGALKMVDATGAMMTLQPDASILAVGGASWPKLGSDGSWVPILENLGVAVTPLEAANAAIQIAWSETFSRRFSGTPLKRIAVSIAGKRQRGEAVITSAGLEGGVVYALSRDIRAALRQGDAVIALDLKPDVSIAELAARLERARGGQTLSNFLRKSAKLDAAAIGLLREGGRPPMTAVALAEAIKSITLRVTSLGSLDRAISTAGGVAWDALDESCMLKTLPGVFIAGEMLDWEAPTGGYLLQACFATGLAAANGAVAWLADNPYTTSPKRDPLGMTCLQPRKT